MGSFTHTCPILTPARCMAPSAGRIWGWRDTRSEAEESFCYFQGNTGTPGGCFEKLEKLTEKNQEGIEKEVVLGIAYAHTGMSTA